MFSGQATTPLYFSRWAVVPFSLLGRNWINALLQQLVIFWGRIKYMYFFFGVVSSFLNTLSLIVLSWESWRTWCLYNPELLMFTQDTTQRLESFFWTRGTCFDSNNFFSCCCCCCCNENYAKFLLECEESNAVQMLLTLFKANKIHSTKTLSFCKLCKTQ